MCVIAGAVVQPGASIEPDAIYTPSPFVALFTSFRAGVVFGCLSAPPLPTFRRSFGHRPLFSTQQLLDDDHDFTASNSLTQLTKVHPAVAKR